MVNDMVDWRSGTQKTDPDWWDIGFDGGGGGGDGDIVLQLTAV